MQKTRIMRRADHGKRAQRLLSEIEYAIAALSDDDLLDLADIFIETPRTPLSAFAATEMTRRGISL